VKVGWFRIALFGLGLLGWKEQSVIPMERLGEGALEWEKGLEEESWR
jgi:hypothetical protein